MRKQDIIITTPKKSTIYAYGTATPTTPDVFADLDDWKAKTYVPAYVLDVKESGHALILVAEKHPDSRYAKGDNYGRKPQATVLDALDYSLADYEARQEVLRRFSHWPLNDEQREEREAALAELKPLPERWEVRMVRTSTIRMLWAEYQERLEAAIGARALRRAKEQEERDANRLRKTIAIQRIADLKIGLSKKQVKEAADQRWVNDKTIVLPVELFEKLLTLAEAAREDAKGQA